MKTGISELMMRSLISTAAVAGLALLSDAAPALSAAPASLNALLSVQFVGNVGYQQQLATAKSLRVHNARIAVRASDVVDRAGRYNWSVVDGRIQPLVRSGIRPIIVIFGIPPGVPGGDPGRQAEAFGEFAAQTARHFGARSAAGPIIYELWNEPNTKTFWGVAPNPEAYAQLASNACSKIKLATPDATVVGLAMEGTPLKAPYYVAAYNIDIYRQWAARAYTVELANCLDGVSMHPYRPKPETYISDEPDLAAFLGRSWRKASPPIVVNSEWGYAVDKKKGVSVTDQAALDLRAALIGVSYQRVTNLYTSADPINTTVDPFDGYGLVSGLGQDKPAAKAVRTLLATVGECQPQPVREVGRRSEVYAVRFHCSGAIGPRSAVAVWSASGSTRIAANDLELPSASSQLDLVSGDKRPTEGAAVSVSQMPILVVSP